MELNQGPGPLTDLLGQLACKAVIAGLNLGIFETLAQTGAGIDEIAKASGADTTGLSLLFGALDSLGYLKKRRGKWSVTSMTKKWMLNESPHTIAPLFHYFKDVCSRLDYLSESIRTGRPPILGYEWLDNHPDRWEFYHEGLKSAAHLVSRELFKKVKIPSSARTLFDLGGGHGQYCIEFCKKHTELTGVIYDWPQAEKIARDNIASSGLSDRIAFRAGDFVKDEIGSDNDVILMFNIIRIFKPEELSLLFCKAHGALKKGGMIIVMDHLGNIPRSRFMRANTFLILLELYNATIGQTHASDDVKRLLAVNGFSEIRGFHLKRSPGLGVVVAIKR